MPASDPQPRSWTALQVYIMATVCLLLGTIVGYLLNSPAPATSGAPPAAMMPQTPASEKQPAMPSVADMKRMADTQAAPLLAELQSHPNDPEITEKIGRSYMAAQQYLTAKQYLEQSVSLKPNPESLNELAFVDYSLGNIDKAIEVLNRGLKIAPKDPKILFNLGMFEWHGRSDPNAAIAAWEKFVRTNPNDPKRSEAERLIAQARQHLNIAPGTKTDKPTM
jgi:cytochrome c-type biogenesis protein CcmH/NrfG